MNYNEIFKIKLDSNNPAVIEENKTWNYSEFISFIYNLRDYLIKNSYKTLAFSLPQGFYAYTIEWASFLSGTTFCPINISDPQLRKEKILNIFKPDIFITTTDTIDNFEGQIYIEELFKKLYTPIKQIKPMRMFNTNRAYVIFTSGTTGDPKGVIIKRKGLENFLNWSLNAYNVTEKDIWAQYSKIGFDLSICDIFTAILGGASLVPFANYGEKMLPAILIKKYKITIWHSVPSIFDIINKSGHLKYDYISSLRLISFCGEKLYKAQIDKIFQKKQDLTIFNTYGPTEVTIFCTYVKLNKKNYLDYCYNTVSIGQALPGYKIELYDKKNNYGELLVISDYIGEGYLNKPIEQAKQGYQVINNQEVFFTGDYVKINNNHIYFDTRKDSQVKVLGNRVDLNEIDAQLREIGFHQVKSIFIEKKIISFVVAENILEIEIKEKLKTMLPQYYIPSSIKIINNMPLNINDKIDEKELIKLYEKEI